VILKLEFYLSNIFSLYETSMLPRATKNAWDEERTYNPSGATMGLVSLFVLRGDEDRAL